MLGQLQRERDMEQTATVRTVPAPSRSTRLAAIITALVVTVVLLVLIVIGSRGLCDFDSTLIGYAVATVFAVAALTYRYTLWIQRQPTWRYFRAGWVNFLSFRNFKNYTLLIPRAWWTDIFAQTFILKRSFARWLMHMCIFWGVILSLCITVPLTFGWIRFTLIPPDHYLAWFFGFPLFQFPIEAGIGFVTYHALDFTAALLIVGVVIALWRRVVADVWGLPVDELPQEGAAATEMVHLMADGEIKSCMIVCSNLMVSLPDNHATDSGPGTLSIGAARKYLAARAHHRSGFPGRHLAHAPALPASALHHLMGFAYSRDRLCE